MWELRGGVDGPYPFGPVHIFVTEADLAEARAVLAAVSPLDEEDEDDDDDEAAATAGAHASGRRRRDRPARAGRGRAGPPADVALTAESVATRRPVPPAVRLAELGAWPGVLVPASRLA